MVRPRAVWVGRQSDDPPILPPHPPAEVSDAELVGRAQGGDPWAEEALFRKHVDYITSLAFRLLRNQADADDVVQETFVDALTQLRDLETPDALRSWLAGIAVHKVHRRFRRQRLLSMLGIQSATDEATLEACAASGTSPEIRAELALLDIALSRVADLDRVAWVLRHVEGYSLEQVATLCACSLSTTKRRILRADASVREHVDVDHETEGSSP